MRLGWSVKRTARELDLSRNTVRKYWDEAVEVGVQVRPAARTLTPEQPEHEDLVRFAGALSAGVTLIRGSRRGDGQ